MPQVPRATEKSQQPCERRPGAEARSPGGAPSATGRPLFVADGAIGTAMRAARSVALLLMSVDRSRRQTCPCGVGRGGEGDTLG